MLSRFQQNTDQAHDKIRTVFLQKMYLKLAQQLGMIAVSISQQVTLFCCQNRKIRNQQYRLDFKSKNTPTGTILQFIIHLTLNHKNIIQQQNLNSINISVAKIFNISSDLQKKYVKISSNELIIENNQHLANDILSQFLVLQQKILDLSLSRKKTKIKNRQDKVLNLKHAIQKNRKSRRKSSKIQLYYQLKGKQDSLQNLSLFYSAFKKNCQERIKNKSSHSPQILRHIELVSTKSDYDLNKQGGTSKISLIMAEYKVFSIGSIHKKVAEQLQAALVRIQNADSSSILEQGKQSTSISEKGQSTSISEKGQSTGQHLKPEVAFQMKKNLLAIKSYERQSHNIYLNQYNILAVLRQDKCVAINSFYSLQKRCVLQHTQRIIYSDFQRSDLTTTVNKKSKYLIIVQQFVSGLVFLRKKKILHRDIKPENILLNQKLCPKIIDFGSAYFANDYKGSRGGLNKILMTTRYYNLFYSDVPEDIKTLYNRYEYETASNFDVYAFGKIMLAFFRDKQTEVELGYFAKEHLISLGEMCTRINPQDRPQPLDIYVYIRLIVQLVAESLSS